MNKLIPSFSSSGPVAILIVNGGDSSQSNRWIRLCLDKIQQNTDYPEYHIYLWNNRSEDAELEQWLAARPGLTLLSAAVYEKLHHPHRTPLQRLYHQARAEGAQYIVALDSDAHPIRADWLSYLVGQLNDGAALAGVWRDEMAPAIRPHIHASCLCARVSYIEKHALRFDFDNTQSAERWDTLAHFTWVAEANGDPIGALRRTNQRNIHHWIGGIYGDRIYHHVAASRERVVFWSNPVKNLIQSDENRQLRDGAADLLFSHYEAYIEWLRGGDVDGSFAGKIGRLLGSGQGKRDLHWWMERLSSAYFRRGLVRSLWDKGLKSLDGFPLGAKISRRLARWGTATLTRPDAADPAPVNALFASFQEKNLLPLPSQGWQSGPPDFVGIGAPKSGTSWWYGLLMEHPQVVPHRVKMVLPRSKETQFFLHQPKGELSAEALSLYRQAFAAPPGAVCGEFSVQYAGHPGCLEQLAMAAPQAKVILILRNPIDRFISHHNHLMTKRGRHWFGRATESQRYLLHTYSFPCEALIHSFYAGSLARLYARFPKERILVLQYERMVQSPAAELARTYAFIGADERFVASDLRQLVNVGSYAIPKPNPLARAQLAAYFQDDVKRLFGLCDELDPALWPDFLHRTDNTD